MILTLLLACGDRTPPAAIEASASVPAFNAVSDTGEPRSRTDLIGHPTVVWFFPAAGTPG